jgi:hypothetical protein
VGEGVLVDIAKKRFRVVHDGTLAFHRGAVPVSVCVFYFFFFVCVCVVCECVSVCMWCVCSV